MLQENEKKLADIEEVEEEVVELDELKELQERKKKLNLCAIPLHISLKTSVCEQVIFITNERKLKIALENFTNGKISILTKLETKMLKDIRILKEKRQ